MAEARMVIVGVVIAVICLPSLLLAQIIPPDCDLANLDGIDPVDFNDLKILAIHWLEGGPEGDIKQDNIVNFKDFALLGHFWSWSCDDVITVDDDGVADFDNIQDAVVSAGAGNIIYIYDGTYLFSDTHGADLTGKDNLRIMGQSREGVVLEGDRSHSGVVLIGCEDILIENLTISTMHQGIYLSDSNNNSFVNISSQNNTSNGIYLGNSHNNNITNSDFSQSIDYHGIYIDDCNYIHIENVTVTDNNKAGVYLCSEDCNISQVVAQNNDRGVWLDFEFTNNNTISDSNLSNNREGLYIYGSMGNYISDNVFYDNDIGIAVAHLEANDDNVYVGNSYRNRGCDRDYPLAGCEYDFTSPAEIVDLSASPGVGDKEIILNWTAVGDNWQYGTASFYVLKYYDQPIDSNNWDLAQTYSQSWTPSPNGIPEIESTTMSDYGTYWFAIKAQDDAGLTGIVSNSVSSVSPLHSITVDSIDCVNTKNGLDCNDTSQITNFLYDTLSVSGYITNGGNVDETPDVELILENANMVDAVQVDVNSGETKLVDGLEWVCDKTGQYVDLDLVARSSSKNVEFPVWSIAEDTDLQWYSPDDYPSLTGIKSDEVFLVLVKIFNVETLPPTHFYEIPITIDMNTPFDVNSAKDSDRVWCDPNEACKICYADVEKLSEEQPYWWIEPLPAGTYTITIKAGHNELDQHIITREITITDP